MSRGIILAFCLIIIVIAAGPASASEIYGQSRTYTQFLDYDTGDNFIPLSEYLNFSVDDRGGSGMSFNFGGWGNADLADVRFGKRYNSDLQYAYVSYNDKSSTLSVKLGRFYVFEGVAAEQVDGLYLNEVFGRRVGLSLYGGIPVETDFDERSGDSIYGGRLSGGIPGIYTIGASYLKEKNDKRRFREEAGADLWFRIGKYLELGGKSTYNVETSGWQEHNYFLSIDLDKHFSLRPRVSWIDYKHYFTAATLSAFTFTPLTINPEERILSIGGEAEVIFTDSVSLTATYVNYSYDMAGDANYYGGKITYLPVPAAFDRRRLWSAGASYHRMSGEDDALKYNEYRLFLSRRLGAADVSLDLHDVQFDVKRNNVEHAYAAVIALGYDMTSSARIAGDLEYGKNPDFDREVKGMIKLLYAFSSGS